jgi:hypothetical protein
VTERIYDGMLHGRLNPLVIADKTFVGTPKIAGRDNHAHTPQRTDRPIVYVNCSFIADGASEALKFSRHWKITIVGGEIIGGVEDGVDIVRGGDLVFHEVRFNCARSKQDVTCKGGARDVRFYRCPGLRRIVLGDFTKYDPLAIMPDGRELRVSLFSPLPRPPVRNVFVRAESSVRVTRWHAERADGDADDRSFRLLVKPYFWARAKFFRESNPAPREEHVIDPREL